MKIATWNVNSLNVRLPQVLDWLSAERPDVLGLQETKLTDDKFPRAAIEAAGYRVVFAGQKTYNGVALLSRGALRDIVTDLPGIEDPQRRVLGATVGKLRVLNLYVPNGESVDSPKYAYKLDWLAALARYAKEQLAAHPRLALIGDFNIAPEERDVHDPKAWAGQVLFSDRERAAFGALVDAGLCDTFRLFEQAEGLYSWWDYRMGAFRRNRGLRIDHILASPELCKACRACRIDTGPRAAERPSDHAPVVAEFDLD
ncbi:MAG TPA: exodeoxyribonuclease III [Acidiferrobacterales bacterium]|jgi:exodeoxyribonuclease-3